MSQCAYAVFAGDTRSSIFRKECSSAMVAAKPARYLNVCRSGSAVVLCPLVSSEVRVSTQSHSRPRSTRNARFRGGQRSRYREVEGLRREHEGTRDAIRQRLEEFRGMWREPGARLFETGACCHLPLQRQA